MRAHHVIIGNIFQKNPVTASGTTSNGTQWSSTAPQTGTISNWAATDSITLVQAGTFTGVVPSNYGTNGWFSNNQTQFDTGNVNIYLILE